MNLRILKRRAKMLDAVSTGIHPSAVVAQLAEKYDVSEHARARNANVFLCPIRLEIGDE